jgi:CheY-like chemotaxis protein
VVPDSSLSPKSILVIDDNYIAREGVAILLRNRGFAVHTANNGAEALAMLASWLQPDLIILDMLMPEMDGWRFLEAIRQSPHDAVPVIVSTGVNLSHEWAAQNRCAGFLKKPFDENDIVAEIGRVLGEGI